MTNQVERFLFEAVANTCEPDDGGLAEIDWLLEGGAAALEGPTLLLALTDGHIGEDFEGGDYFVLASDYDAAQSELAALREELVNTRESHESMRADLIATDARLTAAEQRNAVMTKALERITRPHDCGCVPCTGSCSSKYALEITLEEIREIAGAALKPTESGASE